MGAYINMFPFLVLKYMELYNFYDDLYSFNDLSKNVDSGLNDYIASLKKGTKYEKEIRQAVYDLMSGIKDGTVTFKDGRYYDSQGRYHNSEDRNKDVYGWAANYIYINMRNTPKYVVPEDTSKKKWNDLSLSHAFVKDIFNTDKPNITYFLDLDKLDENTNTRATTNRIKIISDWLSKINDNFFNQYTGYTDEDKLRYINLANEAISKLLADGLTDDDYLYLQRVLPSIPWSELLATKQEEQKEEQKLEEQLNITPSREGFTAYLNTNYEIKPNNSSSLSLSNAYQNKYGPWTNNLLVSIFKSMDELTKYNYLITAINNPTYNFGKSSKFNTLRVPVSSSFVVLNILQNMIANNELIQDSNNPNIYYIPKAVDKTTNSGFYYDNNTKTIYKKNLRDIPYWQNVLYNKYRESLGLESWIDLYFTVLEHKNGGILKAQKGTKTISGVQFIGDYYNDIFTPTFKYISDKLNNLEGNDLNAYVNYLNNMLNKHSNIYNKVKNKGYLLNAYVDNEVGTYLNDFKSGYNNEFNDNIGYNLFGINNSLNLFSRGINTNSGDWSSQKYKTDNIFSGITDSRRLLGRKGDFTNELLKTINDLLKGKGLVLNLGLDNYYRLNIIGTDIIKSNSDISKKILELSKETLSSKIDRTEGDLKNTNTNNININKILPDLLDATRLFGTIKTNNKVTNIIKKSLNPILQDTYELYSPVTGAFSEMQFRNRQAANVRRLGSLPFTSDSNLILARNLEANRLARELEYQGFLADDKEIKRTQAEALKRLEDNAVRRSAIANANRASINQTNRELAQLEATRNKLNWESINNFLLGYENRLRAKQENDREREINFKLSTAEEDINYLYLNAVDKISEELNKWRVKNPEKDITEAGDIYTRYRNNVRELNKWKLAQTNSAIAGIYNYNYNSPYINKTIQDLIRINKKGGILK